MEVTLGVVRAADDWEPMMADTEDVFLYFGTYYSELAARDDRGVIGDLHLAGAVGTYDAAVITRGEDGHVHLSDDGTTGRRGTWKVITVGAVIGLIFPPSMIGSDGVGSASGGIGAPGGGIGRPEGGRARPDLKEFGELIHNGQAALVVIGEHAIADALANARLRAFKHIARPIEVRPADLTRARGAAASGFDRPVDPQPV